MTLPGIQWTVLVHEAEEGGYWAEVVELPGCVSQGETREELIANITETIESCVMLTTESHFSGATFTATWVSV